MNKGDLINAIAKGAEINKAQAERALNSALESVTGALGKGEKVTLVGFGTFSVFKRKARDGRNPRTGAKLKIGAKNVPRFAAGSKLKESAAKARI